MSERIAQRVVAIVALAVVSAIALASLPIRNHATGVGEKAVRVIGEIAPQGWGFFTRDPREPITQAWVQYGSGEWHSANRGPNATVRKAFGFDRSSRLGEYDVTQVLAGEDVDELWVDCTGNSIVGCAERAEAERGVQRWQAEGFDLRLCGDVLLLDESPVPLDFAGLQYDAPRKAMRAAVRCEYADGSS